MKTCSVCRHVKALTEFSRRAASPDGLSYKCRACFAEYAAAWRSENPEAFKTWAANRKPELSANYATWRESNKGRRSEYMVTWLQANKARVAAKNARRHAAKLRATPAWADQDAIDAIYARAAEMTKLTGVRHEVDHIYPLQGRLVCGLHCESNLQVLTKTENIRKLNRMPASEELPA